MPDYIFIVRDRHGFKPAIDTRFFDEEDQARAHAESLLTIDKTFSQVRVTDQWGVELFKLWGDKRTIAS